ncbi:MAG: hypothetical protein ABR543_03310 [Gemmatimonadaceae bacterium]
MIEKKPSQPPQPGQRAAWQHKILAAFTERLLLKGAAVLFALLLWLVARTRGLSP